MYETILQRANMVAVDVRMRRQKWEGGLVTLFAKTKNVSQEKLWSGTL